MPLTDVSYQYGDADEPLGGFRRAGGQTLTYDGPPVPTVGLVGDAPGLTGFARGGADVLSTSSFDAAVAIGDALTIGGLAAGGRDSVRAMGRSEAYAYGDALTMDGLARGGNDAVQAYSRFGSFGYGDAERLSGLARGGNDTVVGSADLTATLSGDADLMSGWSRGGNDRVQSASSFTFTQGDILYGDARILMDHAVGGDDVLTGGTGASSKTRMYGDGEQLLNWARGGNDVLVSGPGADVMWGDAAVVGPRALRGADRFVFGPSNGQDQIMDFQPGRDRIELDGQGIRSMFGLAGRLHDVGIGVLIDLDGGDVLVQGVTLAQFRPGDFLFG